MQGANEEGHTARQIIAAKGARQITLKFMLDESVSVTEVLALSLMGSPSTATGDASALTRVLTQTTPNFTLSRSVGTVLEDGNTAYITVGVQNLKDQSATLTVAKANIVSATDGNGNVISIQPGGQVTVTQDTSVTFRLRDPDRTSVNVVAEGKNGTVSSGKVTFATNFIVVRSPEKRGEQARL